MGSYARNNGWYREAGVKATMNKKIKRITPVIAIVLVVAIVANTIWVSAAQVSITRAETEDSRGIANNYLVDSTDYLSQRTLERMYEVLTLAEVPTTWQGYEEKAGIHIAREEYEKALDCIGKAVELCEDATVPEKASLWLQKGCLHTIREEYDEALEALKISVSLNPESSECYLILAQIYLERQDEENTLFYMEAYLEMNPGNAEAEEMVAQLYMAKQDYAAAKKWLKKAQESGGGATTYYQYGLCLLQESNFDEALEYLDKAIEMDDRIGDVYYYRGICRLASGAYEEALQDLKLAEERTEDSEIREEIVTLMKELTGSAA